MTTKLNPENLSNSALEQAIKKHLEQNNLPDFSNCLLDKILIRLNYESQLRTVKPKLWTAVGVFVCGLGLLAFGIDMFLRVFVQTPISHYFSLMSTDFGLIIANWQDYSLGILERLPLGGLALILFCLLGSILLVDFASRRLLNFRRALNSIHYGSH